MRPGELFARCVASSRNAATITLEGKHEAQKRLCEAMSESRAPGTRKPYRISKPRERWTDVEHDRFVAAINQHGRNWRKIVQEVGTRSVAQVRSHAQKYFLKLEKNGNTEEVPPARAKRPASKPYPIKNGTSEGRTQDAQGSLPPEGKRPRRTERPISKPLHTDFTLLEESPAISTDCDSIAFLLSEEGNGSNNDATTNAAPNNNSGSNGTGVSASKRQSSTMSTADITPDICLADETMPSPDSKMFPDDHSADREQSDPTDASSGAVGKPDAAEPPNYGEFYDAVGKVYTNHQGSNHQLMQQLGESQRSELVHMLYHLTGEMRDSVPTKEFIPLPAPEKDSAVDGIAMAYREDCPLQSLNASEAMSLGACSLGTGGLLTEGGSDSNFPILEESPEAPLEQPSAQGASLVLEAQSTDLEHTDWRLGMSGDLGAYLQPPIVEYSPYQPSQLIDSKIFDY